MILQKNTYLLLEEEIVMLIANSNKGDKYDARTFRQEESHKIDLFCPSCHKPVFYKQGKVKLSHFAHFSRKMCDSFSEGETPEHLAGKDFLFQWAQTGELEAYLPKLHQRPDILYNHIAIEVQCSFLPIEKFVERTRNYLKHGYCPWWLFGEKFVLRNRLTSSQKAGTYYHRQGGFYLWLSKPIKKEIWLIDHIRWHYRWGFFYQVKKWPVNSVTLDKLFTVIPSQQPSLEWDVSQYRFFIYKKLGQKQISTIRLQEKLYLLGATFQDLPDWCYEPSWYHFFFEDELLFLRFCYLKSRSFLEWIHRIKTLNHPWLYPLVSQKEILQDIYLECQKLVGKK